jgi:hypothetical protein
LPDSENGGIDPNTRGDFSDKESGEGGANVGDASSPILSDDRGVCVTLAPVRGLYGHENLTSGDDVGVEMEVELCEGVEGRDGNDDSAGEEEADEMGDVVKKLPDV